MLLYCTWNGKIILPFYSNENDLSNATKLSLIYLFKNESNINTIFNTKYVKNQTLFNMIMQNTNMGTTNSLKLLIDYKFDFQRLINVYDNVKHTNGLLQLCNRTGSYKHVKMLFDHCNNLQKCKIDITHCDIKKQNALFYAAMGDINTFKYFLSNKCFPNHDQIDDKNVQTSLKQKNINGSTVAHRAAMKPKPDIVNTFKLLQKKNFNFNVYDNYGQLPIHVACSNNCFSLLSWMIDEEIFDGDINCKTKYSRNESWNGRTPLHIAVKENSVECVDLLCKQRENVVISTEDIYAALKNDNVEILKFLFCKLFFKCEIKNWIDIERLKSSNIISSKQIESMILYSKKKCRAFLNDLFGNGYEEHNFKHIVLKLNYNLKTVLNDSYDGDEMKEEEEISSSLYEIIDDNLGSGTFGQVKLGKHKKTGEKVAIKYIEIDSSSSSHSMQLITSEIESLKKLSIDKNIINLLSYEIYLSCHQVLLYFEYCQYGDLHKLLNQCDYFSLRISFKYFFQLLCATATCHKLNIVHRDLKLKNILISDTFQLKIADFGLSSITGDKIFNVGTPMYKSPELIESYTSKYDINDIIVLKSCDVFSLAIIFWQMMNGIQYLPFKCYKNNGIHDGNYGLMKKKKFDKFWDLHQKCNMMSTSDNTLLLLLCNLFEQMFEYNPHERITIESILKHEFIVSNENNALFHMNDTKLEAFVRDRYHQTKNIKTKHTLAPQTYYSHKTKNNSGGNNVNNETSGVFPWVLEDSSQAQISPNASKIYADDNKIIYSYNPLVVMVGLEKKNDTIGGTTSDYIDVKQILHDIKHFDIIYHDKNHQIVYLAANGHNDSINTNNNNNDKSDYKDSVLFSHDQKDSFSKKEKEKETRTVNSMIEKEFGLSWTIKDLDKFNDEIVDILQREKKYDCLIYIVSCHSSKHYFSNGKNITILYDSFENEYCCNEKIFNKFNNRNCSNLEKKAKIFVIHSQNTIVDHNNNNNHNQIDYVDQYKRVIYANTDNNYKDGDDDMKQGDKNANDGGLLINSFCVSLCNNTNDDQSIKDLNDIVKETESRIKKVNILNQLYDENFIPDRCQIVFTSLKPLQSTKYVEIVKNNKKNNNGVIETVNVADPQLQQSDTAHTPDPVNDYDATK